MKNIIKQISIILLILIISFSCKTDDVLDKETLNNQIKKVTTKTISAKDIPNIISDLENTNGKDLKFTLKNTAPSLNKSASDLIIGTLNTDVIKQSINTEGRSNYSFVMQKDNPNGDFSVINYVLKEVSNGSTYSYFIEYVPDSNWLRNNTIGESYLRYFSGFIRVYDRYGVFIGENRFEYGVGIPQNYERTPCPPSNGTGTIGGGGSTSDGASSSSFSSPGTSTNGGGSSIYGGTGGYNISVSISCGCDPGHDGGSSSSNCTCTKPDIIIIEIKSFDSSTSTINEISNKSVLRNPCDDDCNSVNDCEWGFDNDCNCLPNPNEEGNENSVDAINLELDLRLITSLNNELCENLTSTQISWITSHSSTAYDILGYLQSTNNGSCSNVNLDDFFAVKDVLPTARFDRYMELNAILQNNPWALIQDCAQQNGLDTSNYINLYNHTIPEACQNRLDELGPLYSNQPISDGNVPLANIDYYPVEITTYPDFDGDNNPDSESEIYQKFREKFTDLASGEKADFQFSCNVPGNPDNTGDISWEFTPFNDPYGIVNDAEKFVSNDPITSVIMIESDAGGIPTIAADDGAIIVSGFTTNDWTISTIRTPNNGDQPFSGNRQWGWLINENGNLELFTRAVDVANISKFMNFISAGNATTECQQKTYYNIAAVTWANMQDEIAQWIIDNGGQATVAQPKAVRVDKEKIKQLLESVNTIDQLQIDQIPCD